MTGGIEQTLPRLLIVKASTERQQHGKGEKSLGFDQALRTDNAPSQRATANGRQVAEPTGETQKWIRFGSKLGAAINKIPVLDSKEALADRAEAVDPVGAEFLDQTAEPAPLDDADEPPKDVRAEEDGPGIDVIPVPVTQSGAPASAEEDRAGPAGIKGDDPATIQAPGAAVSGAAVASAIGAGEATQPAQRGTTLHRQRNDDASATGGEHSAKDRGATVKGASRERQAEPPSILPRPEAGDRAPSQRPEQAARPSTANSGQSAKEPDLKSEHPEPTRVVARATVLSEQSFPAPPRSTSLALAETLAMTGSLKFAPAGPPMDATRAPLHTAPAHSLSLQLHPAELGIVTANLKFAGEQLTIELEVENDDAYRTLVSDSDTLVKSLRAMGYDIDRVTVLQPATPASTQARADTSASSQTQFRQGNEQTNSGGSGNGGTGNRQPEGGSVNASANPQGASMGDRNPAGGVYI